ncbi:MAG: metalloregulator ArsR/SmtB family transcription factor [Bacillota bacterium]
MDLNRLARCLADPTRTHILDILARGRQARCVSPDRDGGVCVCDIVAGLGLSQSRISYHLKELKEAGLVTETTRGWWKYYALSPGVFHELARELVSRYGQREEIR